MILQCDALYCPFRIFLINGIQIAAEEIFLYMKYSTDFSQQPLISTSEHKVKICSAGIRKALRLFLIGDYHCTLDDERGIPYVPYSARMAQYGNHDMDLLQELFCKAQQEAADGILLLGDMISFPSEAGVEKLAQLMENSPVPCYFIAGNHDWHYEGVSGSDMAQRREWISKRLERLYAGRDPMKYTVEINGVKILMMDNSVYEILPEQLSFLEKELAGGNPILLGCHIPLHIPGVERSVTSYGCGHPLWCEANDPYYKIEQREPWAKEGLSRTTFDFCEKVMCSENVLGILAGHTHQFMVDSFLNKFQLVVSSKHHCILDLEPGGSLL